MEYDMNIDNNINRWFARLIVARMNETRENDKYKQNIIILGDPYDLGH